MPGRARHDDAIALSILPTAPENPLNPPLVLHLSFPVLSNNRSHPLFPSLNVRFRSQP
jgi:hypothetical protein